MQLGPGLCLARVPTGGRNFEYLAGEDPHLGAMLAGPVVKGIQSKNIIANAKHWVLNSQETDRMGDDAIVDERTRFELYVGRKPYATKNLLEVTDGLRRPP